jgi:hypothetical protein
MQWAVEMFKSRAESTSTTWAAATGAALLMLLVISVFFVDFSRTGTEVAQAPVDIYTADNMPPLRTWPAPPPFVPVSTQMVAGGKPLRLRLAEVTRNIINNNLLMLAHSDEQCMAPAKYDTPWSILSTRASRLTYANIALVPDPASPKYMTKITSGDQSRIYEFRRRFNLTYGAVFSPEMELLDEDGTVLFDSTDEAAADLRTCIQHYFRK